MKSLKPRKLVPGNRNLVGARVTQARLAQGMKQVELLTQLQLAGIDLSVPALSLLEGQKRPVTDFELSALADILHASVDWFLGREEDTRCGFPDGKPQTVEKGAFGLDDRVAGKE